VAIESFEQGYNWLWLLVTGLFCTGLGVVLILDPDMGMQPAGPRAFTDYLPGAGAFLGGLIILSFSAWVVLRKKSPDEE
jgi:hypothetical protein